MVKLWGVHMFGRKLAIALAVITLASATAAEAKKPTPVSNEPATLCKLSDITVGASGQASLCGGWYTGNLNGGSDAMNAASAADLNTMLGVTTYTAAFFDDLSNFKATGSVVDFTTALYGETIVSFHVGAAKGQSNGVGYESTAFYEFDAGDLVGGLKSLTFNLAGLSNVELISTGTYQQPPCTLNCGPPPCTENCGPPPCTIDCGPPPCTLDCGPPPCTGLCGGGGEIPGVPEPAAWALMILGFGGAGAMLRRRRAVLA
jgi:hypothetical protein